MILRGKQEEKSGIVEEYRESRRDAEYRAISSLSLDKVNVEFDDILRADEIMHCWREAGKIVATMPKPE